MNTNLNKISFIIGLVSVVLSMIECFLPLIILGVLLGIAALVLGIISNKQEKNKYSYAAIVLGTTGIIVALVWLHLLLIVK